MPAVVSTPFNVVSFPEGGGHNKNYVAHCRAAGEIVKTFFDAKTVVTEILSCAPAQNGA